MLTIVLPYPPEHCWPNKRSLNGVVNSIAEKKAKGWALLAARQVIGAVGAANLAIFGDDNRVCISIECQPMPSGPCPDADNVSASAKHYLDAIAVTIGINDRSFNSPVVTFGKRIKGGQFVISVGEV